MNASVDIDVGLEPSWREILEEAANWGASKRLCTTFDIRVRVRFSSTTEFLKCDETRLVRTQRGLGKKMELLVAHLRTFFCEARYVEKKKERRFAELEGRVAQLETRLACPEQDRAVGTLEFTADDLLEVAAIMERYGIGKMDFTRMAELLRGVGRAG